MLPGFRFLLAAIILSLSVLVFGLGAAALLRAAHEQFAGNPAWHAASRETTFAQPSETARPVLAMLRFDTPVAEKPSEDPPAAAPAERAEPMPATSGQSETIAALGPEASNPAPSESPANGEAATDPADSPARVDETRIADAETALPPSNEGGPAASEPAEPAKLAAASDAQASIKIAALGSPPAIPEAEVKDALAKHDANLIKQRLRARRAALRHRLAARARLAAQQAMLFQQRQPQLLFAIPFAPQPIRGTAAIRTDR